MSQTVLLKARTMRSGQYYKEITTLTLAEDAKVGDFIPLPKGFKKGMWDHFEIEKISGTPGGRVIVSGIYRQPRFAKVENKRIVELAS